MSMRQARQHAAGAAWARKDRIEYRAFYMDAGRHSIVRRVVRAVLACAAAAALTVVMTWPLAAGFNRLGRTAPGDGPYAIWNVSWVAHALTSDPLHLLDANIFHPDRATLAYSEINLVAGIVAVPGWLATANPYVAQNSALMFAFATSLLGMGLLARHVTGSTEAAGIAAVLYAFYPYFFAHTAHIQLLMGGGIPLALLLMYRVADSPSPARGVALGVALAAQALACAYYGIFAGLLVGYAGIVFAITRRRLREGRYWTAIAIAAVVSMLCVLPFFLPFVQMQQEGGFRRTLDDSIRYSANLSSYLASPAHAHRWLLTIIGRWPRFTEVLFPGLVALALAGLGLMAAIVGSRGRRDRAAPDGETMVLFGSIGALAFWASFGPGAGLYALLYHTIPLFSFLRAPSRLGPVVMLAIAIFAALGARWLLERIARGTRRTLAAAAVAVIALLELNSLPFPWERAPALPKPYEMLAVLPRGPVAEFPFYGGRVAYHLHTQYMLFSTAHWFPLVNGYSDHIPREFREAATVLDSFPSNDSFSVLKRRRVRYIAVHWDMFGPRRAEIEGRLRPYAQYLRPLAADAGMTLYEVVFYP
jgi:hypothetical protein